MFFPEFASSIVKQHVEAIVASDPKRPHGMVDWMHYGYLLRYRLGYDSEVENDWRGLDNIAEEVGESDADDGPALPGEAGRTPLERRFPARTRTLPRWFGDRNATGEKRTCVTDACSSAGL